MCVISCFMVFLVLVVFLFTLCTKSLEMFQTMEMCVKALILGAICIVTWGFVWMWSWYCFYLYAVAIVTVEFCMELL